MIGLSYSGYMEPNVQREVYRHFNSVYRGEAEKKTMLYNIIRKDRQTRLLKYRFPSLNLPPENRSGSAASCGISPTGSATWTCRKAST